VRQLWQQNTWWWPNAAETCRIIKKQTNKKLKVALKTAYFSVYEPLFLDCRGLASFWYSLFRVRVTVQSYITTGGPPISSSWRQAHWDSRPVIFFQLKTCSYRPYVTFSDGRMGLSFTIAAGPRQRSHSQVLVPRDSWPHFTVSDSRLPQPWGPGSRIYILQEYGGPVIPPDTGSFFVVSYLSQGYGGSIRPRLRKGSLFFLCSLLLIWSRGGPIEDTSVA
jgi:hypothetical protein